MQYLAAFHAGVSVDRDLTSRAAIRIAAVVIDEIALVKRRRPDALMEAPQSMAPVTPIDSGRAPGVRHLEVGAEDLGIGFGR